MARRKKAAPRRARRSPYERSLEYATKRLTVAIAEEKDCQIRLAALHKEIPYLQTVIRALTPAVTPRPLTPATALTELQRRPTERIVSEIAVPEHLRKFLDPSAAVTAEAANLTDDDFIPDVIPGQEILE